MQLQCGLGESKNKNKNHEKHAVGNTEIELKCMKHLFPEALWDEGFTTYV